ncbi:tryptophan halogenase family protein [Paraglaciecola hydrolytica]|uniref:Tryptophan halogenase n=1 Tax=Paraglaciecola hydrolytica TaxID=1799789 RepID=A0A148KN51_9ALTE|nr:tryptophan halogenase family protein [Paraglaciecola hydrolytica]KXI27742.1 tryptophan halogenase [Paraglaciecola hydrolytica]
MRVCILGGGTAGWMTAAALSKKLKNIINSITLVESDTISTVGVGEATLPHIRLFNEGLGIDESAFMKQTEATYKLGIEFCDWGRLGDSYVHPFGDFGQTINGIAFYQHLLKLTKHGDYGVLNDYAFGIVAAKNNKFQLPKDGKSPLQQAFGYAYQFDAGLYAKFLSGFAQNNGVRRIEGIVVDTLIDKSSGDVTAITLDDGQQISADLFIDCSGFRGVLIEQTLQSGYQDWSQWLPCNRAVAVPCERHGPLSPYTRATARQAGWQWRIPLQHRTGNGHVYWDEFISEDEATSVLLKNLDGPALSEPKQLYFKTGRRNHFWKNNVVAIGLAGGFLEPLESTSIHLIQEGITNLLELFPHESPSPSANTLDKAEYNARMALQFERVRDFLLLHYVATKRDDSEMWRYFSNMTLPDSLQEKIDYWLHRGYVQRYEFGSFLPPSWIAVMLGQNLRPQHYDPRVDNYNFVELKQQAQAMRTDIANGVNQAKNHADFLVAIGAASNSQLIRAKS